MLNLNSIMIGTQQFDAMVSYYEKVIGKAPEMIDREYGMAGWKAGDSYFTLLRHSEIKGGAKEPGRVILNFDTKEVQKEFDRIKDFGGTVIRAPYEMEGGWIATLADPDGNYFQLITPMEM